jgi:S1-C subfamily serine protease
VNNFNFGVEVKRGRDYVLSTDAGDAFGWSSDRTVESGSRRSNVSLLFDIPPNATTAVFAVRPLISRIGDNAPQLYEIPIPARATAATLAPTSNTPLSGEELTRRVKPALGQIVATNSRGQTGGGTGFIVGTNGIMVTNRHVVDDAQTVSVRMNTLDGQFLEFTGTVLGRGIVADLAVVRLPAGRTYTPLPLANSDGVFGTDEVTAC